MKILLKLLVFALILNIFAVERIAAQQQTAGHDLSLTDYNHAIRLDPNNSKAYYDRAYTYYYRGDYDFAIADFTQALLLDPDNDITKQNLEFLYEIQRR